MKKVYLMKGAAALMFGLVAASCNKMEFADVQQISDEQIKANAEQALGVTIDPNQTWVMTQNVTANIAVNGDYGVEYEITIYENNPFAAEEAVVLGRGAAKSYQTEKITFTAPKALTAAYVALKDAKGYNYIKPVKIENAAITVSFDLNGTSSSNAPRRANYGSDFDGFTIPTYPQPAVSQYLEDAREIDSHNASNDYSLSDLSAEEQAQVPESDKIQMQGWVKVSQKKLKMTHDWNGAIPALGLTNNAYGGNDARTLYIEGAKWTVPSGQATLGQGSVVVVGANAEINIPEGVTLNTSGDANYNCQIIVLPTGKITGKGKISFNNGSKTGKYDYNGGTIGVGRINNNGGELYNAGIIKADVIEGGAGGSVYINAGRFEVGTTDDGSSTANMRILNNCYFNCTNKLACRNIVLGTAAYMHAGSLYMSASQDGIGDESYINANSNSMLDVTGKFYPNSTTISGPSNGAYALIQFGEIGRKPNYSESWVGGQQQVTAGRIVNNVYISVDQTAKTDAADTGGWSWYTEFSQLVNGNMALAASWGANYKSVGNGNATIIKKGEQSVISKTADECSPAITPSTPTIIVDTYPIYSYAFEDTKAGDYDMNDVVIKAQETKDGKINLTLVALGATLDLNIRLYPAGTLGQNEVAHYSGEPQVLTDSKGNNELHAMMGVSRGTMVNTTVSATRVAPITIQIDKGSYNPAHLPLAIYSTAQGEMRLAGAGQAPFGVIVPIDWQWPTERVNITTAYNAAETEKEGDQSFGTFAHESGKALNWFNYPTGSVMK